MPLKLIPPRPGKTPFWSVRGTHLGVYVDKSTKLAERRKAAKLLAKWRDDIEQGQFVKPGEATFLTAAVAYMEAGGERTFLSPLIGHFGETPLRLIDQAAIDDAAGTLYPGATNATRNRQVYTPVSAVLKRAGVTIVLRRPDGASGARHTSWLWPEQAFALLREGAALDAELGIMLRMFLYTGMRLGEGLGLHGEDIRMDEAFAYVRETKNDDPRPVFLPPAVLAALASHPRGLKPGVRVFRFTRSGRLYALLRLAAGRAEVTLPKRQAFHLLRHTWATWMRRYGGTDTAGLVGTRAWRDRKSAARYEHTVLSEDALKARLLPVDNSWNIGDSAQEPQKSADG